MADTLDHAARQHGHRVAVVDAGTRFTYGLLCDRARRLARVLARIGVAQGDRVAVLAANGHRYVEIFLGLPASGRVIVPLNTRLAETELCAIVRDSGARVLLADRDPGRLAEQVERVVMMPSAYETLLADAVPSEERVDHEHAIAALFYTGGTTGRPKGVILTHRNLLANALHKTIACSLGPDDVFLAAPAMFHVAGIAPLLGLVWLGASMVTVPAFDPEVCLDRIAEDGVTVFMPVPTMLAALTAAQRARARDVTSLRMLGHAGSPIAHALIEQARDTFPRCELAQFYGATETCSIVTCLRNEDAVIGTALLGSCGRPVPGVAVRVVRADGSPAGAGEVGEVWVRGANVSPGYWGDEGASSATFGGGWYRSGDAGVMTEDGHLFIVDRVKDMIVSGGENVYSIEVEDALQRHPSVVEAAVFGVPDPVWGEAVHAVVVVHPGAAHAPSGADLREHCRRFIAGYKVPKHVDVQLEPLPKSGPGKVLKRVLREPYWRGAPASAFRSGSRG